MSNFDEDSDDKKIDGASILSPSAEVNLIIKSQGGAEYKLSLEKLVTLSQLKEKVSALTGSDKVKLIHKGKTLNVK